jgi:hypothetical protein
MVNLNFDKFNKSQKKHESRYVGGEDQPYGANDGKYNNRGNTNKSVGAAGRKLDLD